MMKPILTVVLPLLTTVLQWIQVIAQQIEAVFTKLAGLLGYEVTDYTQNVDINYDSNIKDGAEEDSEALKKLDTQLAGIDEITKITRQTESKPFDLNLGDVETGTGLLEDLDKEKNKLKLPQWLQNILDSLKKFEPALERIKKLLKDIFKNFVDGLFLGLGIDTTGLQDFKQYWDKFTEYIKSKWDRLVNALKDIWKGIKDIFTIDYTVFHFDDSGILKFSETFNVLKDLEEFLKQLAHTAGYVVGLAFDTLAEAVLSCLEAIGKYLQDRGPAIAYELHKTFTFGTDILQSLETILEGVREKLNHFASTLGTTIGNTLMAAAETALGFVEYCLGTLSKYLDQNGEYITKKINSIFTIYDETLQKLQEAVFWVRDVALHIFENEDAQQIGADLLAIFTDAWLNIREFWAKVNQDIVQLLVQPFLDNKGAILEAVDNFLEPVSHALNSFKEACRYAWESFQEGYDKYIGPTVDRITQALSNLIGTVMDCYNNNIAPILDAWAKKFDEVLEHAKPCFDAIVQFFGNAIELIGNILAALEPLASFVIDLLGPVLGPLIRGLGELVADVVNIILDCITGILEVLNGVLEFLNGVFTLDWKRCWDGVVEVFKGCWDIVWGILSGLATGLKDAFSAIIDSIIGVFKGLITAVKNLFGIHSPSTVFANMGKDLIRGLWNGISSLKDWIWSKIKGFFGTITDAVKDFFGIHSPSKLFAWIGKMLMKGLGVGIDSEHSPIRSLNNIMNDAYNTVNTAMKDINKMMNINGTIKMAYAMDGMMIPEPHKAIELAKGGIATSRTSAVIGEAGKEAVLPLENNTGWMDDLSAKITANINENMQIGDGNVVLQVNEDVFGTISKRSLLNMQKSNGKKIFVDTRRR